MDDNDIKSAMVGLINLSISQMTAISQLQADLTVVKNLILAASSEPDKLHLAFENERRTFAEDLQKRLSVLQLLAQKFSPTVH